MEMSQRVMWLPICRRNWRGERSRGCSQMVTGVRGAKDVVSGAASGDGGTGMSLQMVMENWKALNMSFRRWTFTLSP